MADNDILGKPKEDRPASEKAELIAASRMSKKYDSIEVQIDGSTGPTSIAGLVAGGQIDSVRGAAFVKHARAHRVVIIADQVTRFRFNDVANDEVTVGDINSSFDSEDSLELDSVFFETTVAGGIKTKLQIVLT